MLKGKEMTVIVDDIASRISRNANIGGETLTKAGFGNVKITVHLTVETKDKANGSAKMVRETAFGDYGYAISGVGDGSDSGSGSQNGSVGGSVAGVSSAPTIHQPSSYSGGKNRGW